MNTEITLLSDGALDSVAGGMMKIPGYTPTVVPTGGARTGAPGTEAVGDAILSFALGGFYGLGAYLAGLF